MSFSIVAAIADNNVIGSNNRLPWKLPEDLMHFYQLIDGKTVVMGRKTYDSIGKPLKNSNNIILTRQGQLKIPGVTILTSLSELLAQFQDSTAEIMVIGGAKIYQQLLPWVNKMYLTIIHANIAGDSFFPSWKKEHWLLTTKQQNATKDYTYSFETYIRRSR